MQDLQPRQEAVFRKQVCFINLSIQRMNSNKLLTTEGFITQMEKEWETDYLVVVHRTKKG